MFCHQNTYFQKHCLCNLQLFRGVIKLYSGGLFLGQRFNKQPNWKRTFMGKLHLNKQHNATITTSPDAHSFLNEALHEWSTTVARLSQHEEARRMGIWNVENIFIWNHCSFDSRYEPFIWTNLFPSTFQMFNSGLIQGLSCSAFTLCCKCFGLLPLCTTETQ
jgi:hypothetical protein